MKYYYIDHPISFPDSFSITDEHANILFQVDTKLNWGRIIKISKEHQTLRILDDKISTYHTFHPSQLKMRMFINLVVLNAFSHSKRHN